MGVIVINDKIKKGDKYIIVSNYFFYGENRVVNWFFSSLSGNIKYSDVGVWRIKKLKHE